jgi:hypothetical protein
VSTVFEARWTIAKGLALWVVASSTLAIVLAKLIRMNRPPS